MSAERAAQTKDDRPETTQRRRQVAGLLLMALIVLVGSVWRAGLGSMFPPGWWRLW